MTLDALTAIEGIRVGHWTHGQAATGCTVVLCVKRVHEVAIVDVAAAEPADAGAPVVQGVVSTELGPLHLIDLPAAMHQLTAEIAGRSRDISGTATTALDSDP